MLTTRAGPVTLPADAGTPLNSPSFNSISTPKSYEFSLIPLILGLLCLSYSYNPYIVIPYMVLIGFGSGFGYTTPPVLIAELYGLENLGSIKSLYSSMIVFGSSIGPVIMGGLKDLNFSIEIILIYFSIYSFVSIILVRIVLHKEKLKYR